MEDLASDPVVARELDHVRRRLIDDYAGLVPASVVTDLLSAAVTELGAGTVHTFVPVLVERYVRVRVVRMLHPVA